MVCTMAEHRTGNENSAAECSLRKGVGEMKAAKMMMALSALVFAFAMVGCMEMDDEGQAYVSYDQSLQELQTCGGILGETCPDGATQTAVQAKGSRSSHHQCW